MAEQITGQPVLQIKLDQQQLARYGVPAKAVTDIIESIGSKPLGEVVEGQLRFPLVVRLPEAMRNGPTAIGCDPDSHRLRRAAAAVAPGRHPRGQGPSTITREWGQRRITVSANVRGRDMGSFVAEAQQRIRGPTDAAARAATSTSSAASSSTSSGPHAAADRRAAGGDC